MSQPKKVLTHKGEFFLKDIPDNRHKGVLTISESNLITLEIFGSFNTPSPAIDHTLYTVWGQSFDGSAISLLNCRRKFQSITFGISEVETWTSSFVLIGGLTPDYETPFFDTASVEIEGLREWIRIDGGTLKYHHDVSEFDYHYKDPSPIKFKINEAFAGAIYFKNALWIGLDYKNQSEQYTRLQLESGLN